MAIGKKALLKGEERFSCKKSGITELVCEINRIKCKFPAILIRHCCHSNECNTLSIHST